MFVPSPLVITPVDNRIELTPAIIPQAHKTPNDGTTIFVISAAKRFKIFLSFVSSFGVSSTTCTSLINSSYTSPTCVPIITCNFPSAT